MRFLVAGSSGFLGSHLCDHLRAEGHHVTPLVRRSAGPGEAAWDPYAGELDAHLVEEADVVVNLAGSPTLGNPHSRRWADNLRTSRVTTTRVLAEAIAASERKPAFLAGNAVGYYGDHGSEVVTEASERRGGSFLSQVTRDWQGAAEPAARAGARVCVLRTAPVIDRANAPLRQQRLLTLAGLSGHLGDGRQYFPVVTLRDWVRAAAFLAASDVAGPVNIACPETPTNGDYTAELARQLHRPAFFHVPAAVIRPLAGRMAPEALGSIRVVPQVLQDAGFTFLDRDVEAVVRAGLASAR
jgi:uncharacterized protein (TIGR01777 family)